MAFYYYKSWSFHWKIFLCLILKVVESAIEGIRKPEEPIYLKLLDQLKLGPAEVVFLDDIGSNVKTAKHLGFQAIKVDYDLQRKSNVCLLPLLHDILKTFLFVN